MVLAGSCQGQLSTVLIPDTDVKLFSNDTFFLACYAIHNIPYIGIISFVFMNFRSHDSQAKEVNLTELHTGTIKNGGFAPYDQFSGFGMVTKNGRLLKNT